jgi:uncharacterized protein YkwD
MPCTNTAARLQIERWCRSIAFAVAVATFAPSALVGQETGNLEELRRQALELVNRDRGKHDLPPLELGPILNEAALSHARDMLERDYYAHQSPEGESVQDRYIGAGGSRWELVAENISQCIGCTSTPGPQEVEELQQGWMDSPEHRENILAEGIERFGFGVVTGAGRTLYAVQTFAGPGGPHGLEPGEETVAVAPEDQSAAFLEAVNAARSEAGVAPLEQSEDLSSAARRLIPDPASEDFDLDRIGELDIALPDQQRARWGQLFAASGSCGGCGREATEADINFFADDWLQNPQYRTRFVSSAYTHLGFALVANGEGKKMAMGLLAAGR